MKYFKVLFAIAALVLFTTNASAQYFALPMTIGVQGGMSQQSYSASLDGDDETLHSGSFESEMNFFNAGIFLDAKYIRASIDYKRNNGDADVKAEYDYANPLLEDETVEESVDITYDLLDFSFIFKYPFSPITNIEFWPALGIAYSHCLRAEEGGEDLDDKSNYNDIYFQIGAGIDFRLSEVIILTANYQFAYNLTPDTNADTEGLAYEDETIIRYYQVNIGIGYRFSGGGL